MSIGKSNIEKNVQDIQSCRNIVEEILNFGVSQEQIIRICYLLSLELENTEMLKSISNVTKVYLESLVEDSNLESTKKSGIIL
jgi:hypothetical protein